MSTVTKHYIKRPLKGPFGGVPYGNKVSLQFTLETIATGILKTSDSPTHVIVAGDVVRIGVLPKGMLLCDALANISTTLAAAASVAEVGFAYVSDADGAQAAILTADADYFYSALAMDGAARTRMSETGVKPERLPGDAYLIMTFATQPLSKAGRVDIFIEGILEGPA
jgi:hypothetical protein